LNIKLDVPAVELLKQLGDIHAEKDPMYALLNEISEEENLKLEHFAGSVLLKFTDEASNKSTFVYYGNQKFALDVQTVGYIADDKVACSDYLESNGIAVIPHWRSTTWEPHLMRELLHTFKTLVIKDNFGTQGGSVFKASTMSELEEIMLNFISKDAVMAISPYYSSDSEYRVLYLDGELQLIFAKTPPHVTGNGENTVVELMMRAGIIPSVSDLPVESSLSDWTRVPDLGEDVAVGWKHNLSLGATATYLDFNSPELKNDPKILELQKLAMQAIKALDMKFGSVDILDTNEGLKIIEINSGVQMDHFASTSPECRKIAKEIYRKVILNSLD